MVQTYRAILRGDKVEWTDEAPNAHRPLQVHVKVLERPPPASSASAESRGRAMAEALSELAERGAFADVADAGAWQRDARRDRVLPGRDE